jgi:hypothetical protein
MRLQSWIFASLAVLTVVAVSGCKAKVGGKCKAGASACVKEGGALFCGDDNKYVATGCHGPNGCVPEGRTAACDQSVSLAGEYCEDNGNISCTVDKQAQLDCKDHKWVVGATCKGAKGCELKGDELFCDHTIADKADPCHRDGQIACTPDKAFILKCSGGVMNAIVSCRGPKSCTFEEHPEREAIEFNCDDSVAQEGDPCEQENLHACSVDKKQIHVCKEHKFTLVKACPGPKGCTLDSVTERLLCDTGGGSIFSGAGGSSKVSSSGNSAGSAKAAKSATTGSAKPVVSAAASAKPTASASAAALVGSAKPGTSATAAASASAKPVASAAASAKPGASAKPAASAKVKK